MRVAIIGQGDGRERATWSGIPYGLGRAIERRGLDVVHVDAHPPPLLRRPLLAALRAGRVSSLDARHGPEMARLRTAWAAGRLRRLEADWCILLNTGLRLPPGTPFVTLSDLTAAQAMRAGNSDPAFLTPERGEAWREREHRVFGAALACCAASDWTAESLAADYGVARERVHTVGLGMNAKPARREREWWPPRFFFAGREWPRKNGDRLVAAFRRVRDSHPEATLTVVGDHPAIGEPGVVEIGFLRSDDASRARLARLFEESTCFVMPSLMEPFGIAYLEAGAAGLPSIGTGVGGAATAIGDGGLLVDPTSVEAIADAMLTLADAETARTLGARAAEHAARFTWDGVAGRVLDAYERSARP